MSQILKQHHYGHRNTVKQGKEKFGQHFHEVGYGVEPTQCLWIAAVKKPLNPDSIYRRFLEMKFIDKNGLILRGGNTVKDTINLT